MVCFALGTPNELVGVGYFCISDPQTICLIFRDRLLSSGFQIWPF